MLQMQMMGSADVHGIHPWVGSGGGVVAEGVQAVEAGRVIPRLAQITAGEIQVDLATQLHDGPGERRGEVTAAENTEAERQTSTVRICHPPKAEGFTRLLDYQDWLSF